VCTNACKQGLGGFLSQNGHVVFYESRKLKEHERLYATHDLELETIVHALNMLRHYLMGKTFELRIDHSSLKYLFRQPTLNVRTSRWLEFLGEYYFEIKHIKHKEKNMDDELNIRVHEMHATPIRMCKYNLKDRILEAEKLDQIYVETREKIQGKMWHKIEDYELRQDEILMYRGKIMYQMLRS
jgi:hypothetical protein